MPGIHARKTVDGPKALGDAGSAERVLISKTPPQAVKDKKAKLATGLLSSDALMERIRARLKAQLGTEVFSSWFGRLKIEDMTGSEIRFSVPTAFLRSWIVNHYFDLLKTIVEETQPRIINFDLVVRSASRPAKPTADSGTTPQRFGQTPERSHGSGERSAKPQLKDKAYVPAFPASNNQIVGSPLDSRYTFETFIEGPSNRVAQAASRTIAEAGPGSVRFNPLFIHASVGLGKTHLLQAIASAALAAERKPRVVYLTAEYFMWRFATAIRDKNALSLKESLREIDLLIIDDMQFLQGKTIQQEFCHLLNMLLNSAKQVVVAADRPPSELESLEPRVRSRLHGGVALEIGAPDYDMRREILRTRLENAQREDHSLHVPDDVLDHVARTITGSGRELEGAFNQLLFRQTFEQDISLDKVDEILSHLVNSGEPKKVKIEDIQRLVSKHYNVSKAELLSNRRTRNIVKPRQIAMYLAKALTPRSLPEIGRRFGGRDHTTVLHAVRKIEGEAKGDIQLERELELLKRLIME